MLPSDVPLEARTSLGLPPPDLSGMEPGDALHALADWACAEPVVFITGVPRSGTTRVYDLFIRVPDFERRRGAYVESHLMQRVDQLEGYRRTRPLWEFVGEPRAGEDALDALVAASAPLSPSRRWTVGVQAVIYAARLYGGMRRVVEKTPDHALHLSFLASTLPEARFVFMHRHPVAVYASYRKRLATERGRGAPEASIAWLDKTPAQFCWQFQDVCRHAMRSGQALGARFHPVCYEALVRQPLEQCHAIFDAMRVPFQPAYLEPAHAPGNTVDERLYQPIAPPKHDWREYVTPDEARFIDGRLRPLLDRIGGVTLDELNA